MEALTIALVHSGAPHAYAMLAELSAQGMVSTCVLHDDAGSSVLLDQGHTTAIVLDEYLARQRPSVLRLVHTVIAADDRVLAVDEADALRERLDERCRAAGIAFSSAAVVVPHADAVIDPAVVARLWTLNVVVAPEDCGGSRGMIAIELTPERTEPMAVVAALTIGGMWSWMPEAPIDRMQPVASGNPDHVRVARLAVRTVDAGDLTTRVIDWALEPGGAWPLPADTTVHGHGRLAVQQLAPDLAAALGFQYTPLPPVQATGPRKVGVTDALALFAREMWVSLRAKPAKAWAKQKQRLTASVEGFVQRRTFGDDSSIAVTLRGGATDIGDLLDGGRRIERVAALPAISAPAVLSTPEVWNELVSAALGTVDGGPFHGRASGLEPEWQGRRAIVADRSLVAAPPERDLCGFELSAADLALLQADVQTDPDGSTTMIGAADVTSARLVRDRLAELERQAADHIADPEDEAADVHGDGSAGELRARLDDWIARRDESLLWRLGDALARSTAAAAGDLAASEQRLDRLATDVKEYVEQERRHLKRRRRRVALFLIVLLLIVAATVTGFVVVSLVAGLIGLGALVASLLLGGLGLVTTTREEVRLRHRLQHLAGLPDDLQRRRQHAAHEVARLSSINDQLIEWAEVISWSLHDPWGSGATRQSAPPSSTTSELLAFTCGVPDVDDEEVQGEVVRLRRRIAHAGWLQRELAATRAAWEQRYKVVAAVDSGTELDPASDVSTSRTPVSINPVTGEAVHSPRVQLARDVASGRHAPMLRAVQETGLRQVMASRDADRLISRVRCDLPGLSGTEPQDFLASLVEFAPLPAFSQRFLRPSLDADRYAVADCLFGISDSIDVTPPDRTTPSRRISLAGVEDRFLLAAFRIDLSMPLAPRDIRMFAGDHRESEPGASAADIDPLSVFGGVVG